MAWAWRFWRRQGSSSTAASASASRASRLEESGDAANPAAALRVRARRRLVGAAALLLAVVIVVPLVLDPAPRPVADNIPIDIPSEKTPFTPRLALPPAAESGSAPIVPPPEVGEPDSTGAPPPATPAAPAPATASHAGEGMKAAAPERSPSTRATPEKPAAEKPSAEKPVTEKAAAEKAAPEKAASRPATATAGGSEESRARELLEGHAAAGAAVGVARGGHIQVQVAALGSETAAEELSTRLRGAGFAPYTERVETRDGQRYRVRVGPFASRDDAERARARLRAIGVNGNLVAP